MIKEAYNLIKKIEAGINHPTDVTLYITSNCLNVRVGFKARKAFRHIVCTFQDQEPEDVLIGRLLEEVNGFIEEDY